MAICLRILMLQNIDKTLKLKVNQGHSLIFTDRLKGVTLTAFNITSDNKVDLLITSLDGARVSLTLYRMIHLKETL